MVLTPEAIDELLVLQGDQNDIIEAHTEALSKVISFLIMISNEIDHREREVLDACRAINFVRDSIKRLRALSGKEVCHE